MGRVDWVFPEFLEQNGITAYQVAVRVPRSKEGSVYRLARKGKKPSSVDFQTLAYLADAIGELNGKTPTLQDFIRYTPD
jgi:hypothetical protein